MSQRDYYMFELFVQMKPIIKRLYVLNCSAGNIKFFCNCLFNIVHGHIKMVANVSRKKLKPLKKLIELLCSKKVGIRRKRQTLSTKAGLKLLKLIQPSISSHLKKRHGIEQ